MAKNISFTENFSIISGSQIGSCGTVRVGILDFTSVLPPLNGEARVTSSKNSLPTDFWVLLEDTRRPCHLPNLS